jgi:methylated-DNA-protein-cysteine methyltransferase related protein
MNDPFFRQVYEFLARVPRGRVITYGGIALALGRPHGARAVGWAMRSCSGDYPWQRVVNAQGELRTHERLPNGKLLQQALLEEEGIEFAEAGRVDLARYEWTGAADG